MSGDDCNTMVTDKPYSSFLMITSETMGQGLKQRGLAEPDTLACWELSKQAGLLRLCVVSMPTDW